MKVFKFIGKSFNSGQEREFLTAGLPTGRQQPGAHGTATRPVRAADPAAANPVSLFS